MRTQAENGTQAVRRCEHCRVTKTPRWRNGPMGPRTLCNACGVRYSSGRLLPEYRPTASPTFVPYLHSNRHRNIIEMRNELVEVPVQLTSPNPPSRENHFVDLSGSSSESEKRMKNHKLQAIEEKLKPKIPLGPIDVKPNNGAVLKRCQQCMITKTLHWRDGKTLCNACWVHYNSRRLFPEHPHAASSTFAPLHSNSHRKVNETRTKRLHPATFSPCASTQLTSPNPPSRENHLIVLSGSSSESECVKESENGKKCHGPQAIEVKTLTPKISLGSMDEQKNNGTQAAKICQHCAITKTAAWRNGPMGPKTLCNACGIRYSTGKLLPEYRPAASPTFVPSLYSSSHKKVIEIRNKLVEEKSVHVAARTVIPDIEQPSSGNDI